MLVLYFNRMENQQERKKPEKADLGAAVITSGKDSRRESTLNLPILPLLDALPQNSTVVGVQGTHIPWEHFVPSSTLCAHIQACRSFFLISENPKEQQ